jgi:hypothetical protein
MTVLVLGAEEDEHARHMLDCLRKRGADAELLDSRWFPGRCALTFDPLRGAGNLRLPAGRTLGLETVRAVYWRS